MPGDHSLKKNHDYRLVYTEGRHNADKLLVLYAKPNDRGESRFGITAGRKAGKAVIRNKVKRWIRENYRLLAPYIVQGYDVVFVARASAGMLKRPDGFRAIGGAMRRLLVRQRLLHEGL